MTSATVYRVIVDVVPDVDVSSNSRAHPMAKARKVKALRQLAYYRAREGGPRAPMSGPVQVRALINWPKGRKKQDPSNVEHCLKAYVDGITDAGWWSNDKQVHIQQPIEQVSWGQWSKQGGVIYGQGCVVFDVWQEVENG